jgi:hypothetical protein
MCTTVCQWKIDSLCIFSCKIRSCIFVHLSCCSERGGASRHTRFCKEQNQARHMCAQEIHTYNNRVKISKHYLYKAGNILY